MIFINLLPDIKLEYAKALRIKRLLVLMSAVLITCCIIVVSALFFYAEIQQPRQIDRIEGVAQKDANGQEKKHPDTGLTVYTPADSNNALLNKIKGDREISRILTIQNQLGELPGLRQDRIAVDRLFKSAGGGDDDLAYLESLIPEDSRFTDEAPVESATFNFESNTFTLTGRSDNSQSALELEGTIEYIGIKEDCNIGNITTRIYPFRLDRDISLPPSSTQIGEDDEPKRLSYNLSGIFSQDLFDPNIEAEELVLVVPKFDVGNDNIPQPDAECLKPTSNNERLNPVSGNAAPAADPAAPNGDQVDGGQGQ